MIAANILSVSAGKIYKKLYCDGPEVAANYYFNEIKEGIES